MKNNLKIFKNETERKLHSKIDLKIKIISSLKLDKNNPLYNEWIDIIKHNAFEFSDANILLDKVEEFNKKYENSFESYNVIKHTHQVVWNATNADISIRHPLSLDLKNIVDDYCTCPNDYNKILKAAYKFCLSFNEFLGKQNNEDKILETDNSNEIKQDSLNEKVNQALSYLDSFKGSMKITDCYQSENNSSNFNETVKKEKFDFEKGFIRRIKNHQTEDNLYNDSLKEESKQLQNEISRKIKINELKNSNSDVRKLMNKHFDQAQINNIIETLETLEHINDDFNFTEDNILLLRNELDNYKKMQLSNKREVLKLKNDDVLSTLLGGEVENSTPSIEKLKEEKSIKEDFSNFLRKSSIRVASEQSVNLVSNLFISIIEKKFDSETAKSFSLFLSSEAGKSFLSLIIGNMLRYIPQLKDHKNAQEFSEEFNVAGMAQLGNYLIDEHIIKFIMDMSSALDTVDKVRVESEVSHQISEEFDVELDFEQTLKNEQV